jgi:VanZ family protein
MAVLATLSPFNFAQHEERSLGVVWMLDDVLLNLLLLFPAGFLAQLAHGVRTGPRSLHVLLAALLLSASVELLQLYLPSRHGNVVDIAANTLGAWLGARSELRLSAWLEQRMSEELVLELPLSGALYVVTPLLLMQGLSARVLSHAWLSLPLACFVGTICAALYVQRIARRSTIGPLAFSLRIAAVLALTQTATAFRHPAAFVACTGCAFATTYVLIRRLRRPSDAQRRFEAPTMWRALPWLVLYLLLLLLEPRWFHAAPHVLGGQLRALRLLETFAALTLAGYVVSQLRARQMERRSLVAGLSVVGALYGALAASLQPTLSPASALVHVLAMSLGAASGVLLHHAQISLIKTLRATA